MSSLHRATPRSGQAPLDLGMCHPPPPEGGPTDGPRRRTEVATPALTLAREEQRGHTTAVLAAARAPDGPLGRRRHVQRWARAARVRRPSPSPTRGGGGEPALRSRIVRMSEWLTAMLSRSCRSWQNGRTWRSALGSL
jgi:hypothetical protein